MATSTTTPQTALLQAEKLEKILADYADDFRRYRLIDIQRGLQRKVRSLRGQASGSH